MFVKLWMNSNPITIVAGQTIADADQLLREHKIRRLPVVDKEGHLIGIVSKHDVADALPSSVDSTCDGTPGLSNSVQIQAIMTASPMTVDPLTPLETVAKQMRKHKLGGMPVVQDGKLVGVITESDIFSAFMTMLGADSEGARIEMVIGKTSRALYDCLELCRRYHVHILAITVYRDYSDEHQLVTVRLEGDEMQDMLAALRRSGATVYRILEADGSDTP